MADALNLRLTRNDSGMRSVRADILGSEAQWRAARRAISIRRSCRHRGDVRSRLRHCSLPGFGTKGQSLRANDRDICQSDEGKYASEIVLVMLESGCGRARRIDIAARGRDEHLLVFQQPFSTIRAVAKCFAGNDHAVDPRFKLAWN